MQQIFVKFPKIISRQPLPGKEENDGNLHKIFVLGVVFLAYKWYNVKNMSM